MNPTDAKNLFPVSADACYETKENKKGKVNWTTQGGATHQVEVEIAPQKATSFDAIFRRQLGKKSTVTAQGSFYEIVDRGQKIRFSQTDIDKLPGENREAKMQSALTALHMANKKTEETTTVQAAQEKQQEQEIVEVQTAGGVPHVTTPSEALRLHKSRREREIQPELEARTAEIPGRVERLRLPHQEAVTKTIVKLQKKFLRAPEKYASREALAQLPDKAKIRYVTDESGNPIQLKDVHGKPVVDSGGRPVYLTVQLTFHNGKLYADVKAGRLGAGGLKAAERIAAMTLERGVEDTSFAHVHLKSPLDSMTKVERTTFLAEISTEKKVFRDTQAKGVRHAAETHSFTDLTTKTRPEVAPTEEDCGYLMIEYPQGSSDRLAKVPEEWKARPDWEKDHSCRFEGSALRDRLSVAICACKFLIDFDQKMNAVHSDIKPANIFIDGVDEHGDVNARVGDFGTVIQRGDPLGLTTPKFTPPEVVAGRTATADFSFDRFSMGWTIRDLVYGERSLVETSTPTDQVYPALNPDDPVDQTIIPLLDPDPAKRPDLQKTLEALERIRDGLPQHEEIPSSASPAPSRVVTPTISPGPGRASSPSPSETS